MDGRDGNTMSDEEFSAWVIASLFLGGGEFISLSIAFWHCLPHVGKGKDYVMFTDGMLALASVLLTVIGVTASICVCCYKMKALELRHQRQERLDKLDRELALRAAGDKKDSLLAPSLYDD